MKYIQLLSSIFVRTIVFVMCSLVYIFSAKAIKESCEEILYLHYWRSLHPIKLYQNGQWGGFGPRLKFANPQQAMLDLSYLTELAFHHTFKFLTVLYI